MFGGSNFKKTIIKNKICMLNQIKYWIKFQIKCLESDEVFDLFILSPNLISSDFELFYISQFSLDIVRLFVYFQVLKWSLIITIIINRTETESMSCFASCQRYET